MRVSSCMPSDTAMTDYQWSSQQSSSRQHIWNPHVERSSERRHDRPRAGRLQDGAYKQTAEREPCGFGFWPNAKCRRNARKQTTEMEPSERQILGYPAPAHIKAKAKHQSCNLAISAKRRICEKRAQARSRTGIFTPNDS